MKYSLFLLILLTTFNTISQNVQLDSQTYSPQQLIEDILIDSNCIENIIVTNVIGGDFDNADQSYGYFDATGTTFPIQNGIVLSTGRLQNVEGPNTTLSDDDAQNWIGDSDLEYALNESNTFNATILEFDLTSVANQISFRYIFASEEYQEGDPNTCQYSDLFGFLIKPINEQNYENIALIPNTQTPVKVTTVHPGIPGSCDPINEGYFGSWNDSTSPINFNGQTKVLTATADVTPHTTYHVKLVIADEQNYRYDSAVFLEAGSFLASTDLGPDRLLATNNPLCENETLELNAWQAGSTGFIWYKDGIPNTSTYCLNCNNYNVTEPGIYSVDVRLSNGCISTGEIVIEYSENPLALDAHLIECDINNDGLTYFKLNDVEQVIVNGNTNLSVTNYFTSEANAISDTNPIDNTTSFQNTNPSQIIYARVENQYSCFTVAEVLLEASYNQVNLEPFTSCDDDPVDGFTSFDLNQLQINLQPSFPTNAEFFFFATQEDAFNEVNSLNGNYTNSIENSELIYLKVKVNNQCYALTTIELQILNTPILDEDISAENPIYYCLNSYPETITIHGGILNDSPSNFYYSWNTGEDTSFIEVNQIGTYTVIVTDPNGCSNSRSITVVPSNLATIDEVTVDDFTDDNSITVITSGEGNYAYAIDDFNGMYQQSNIFNNITPGFHTVYVKDTNGCGIVEKIVSVKGFPKFFTPNGDGINDLWFIYGVDSNLNYGAKVDIFDRYGKLIISFTDLSEGWNGNLNGNKLPTEDYWFVLSFPNGKEYKDHFTLKR